MLYNVRKISKQDVLVFLLLIPLMNIVIFFLVSFYPEIGDFLYLNPQNPTIINFFFSHYTHFNYSHLYNNISNYFLVIVLILLLDVDDKSYRKNLAFIFLFLPLFLSSVMLYFSKYSVGNGFSGIVSALFGYFAYSVYRYVKREWNIPLHKNVALLFVLFNILGMLAIYQEFEEFFLVLMLFIVIIFLNIRDLIEIQKKLMSLFKEQKTADKNCVDIIKLFFNLIVFSATITILLFSFSSLFPSNLVTNYGTLTNIMIHYFGYISGLIFPLYFSDLIRGIYD